MADKRKVDYDGAAGGVYDSAAAPILVWPFYKAPQYLRELSGHGGDEDWLAIVPHCFANEYIGWAEDGGSFGCCSVSRHVNEDGSVVLIGAHA